MPAFTSLLLPIVVASVLVFVASSIIHMLTPWHKNDFPVSAQEDAILDALRPLNIPPGDYFMPRPRNRADLSSEAFKERMQRGPIVLMTIFPGGSMSMGRSLGLWFIYLLFVNALIAHTVQRFPANEPHEHILHQCLLVGFAAYGLALVQMSIWYRRSWSLTIKALVDGLIYSAVTAFTFIWLWPAALR